MGPSILQGCQPRCFFYYYFTPCKYFTHANTVDLSKEFERLQVFIIIIIIIDSEMFLNIVMERWN